MLTINQVAKKYNVTRQCIHKWRTKFNMPSMKFEYAVLFDEQAVEEWHKQYKNKKLEV